MRIPGLVLLLLLAPGTATPQTSTQEARFALEIRRPNEPGPTYVALRGYRMSSLFYQPGLEPAAGVDPQLPQPSALELAYRVEGNVVFIAASVLYGEIDHDARPSSLDQLRREHVGSYSAGLNQSVTLSEMEQVGLEPFTIQVLSPKPPISDPPLTTSKAPSILIRVTGQDWTQYEVELVNQSEKTVTAFELRMPKENGGNSRASANPKGLIAPGETYDTRFRIPRSWKKSGGKLVANPVPPVLVLKAVEFDDGTYEGDIDSAAQMAARRIAHQKRRSRINEIVETILTGSESGDSAKIERIRLEVANLAEAPDPRSLERVRTLFPGMSDETLGMVKHELRSALQHEKQSLAHNLDDFERASENHPAYYTLAQWWALVRQHR